MTTGDKAGEQYWSTLWRAADLPQAYDPNQRGSKDYVNWAFHQYYTRLFATNPGVTAGKRFLEIGCAKSSWLPYFTKEHGFQVYGLDYSAIGCEQARAILQNEGVAGEIICADLFTPPTALIATFDVVLSIGLVEHFEDTVAVTKALARFLQPNGLLITIIPNMTGLVGSLQKIVDPAVFAIHVPLSCNDLRQVHEKAGLTITDCTYFLPINLGVLNNENWHGHPIYPLLNQLKFWISKAIWLVDGKMKLGVNGWSSPYIICSATKLCASH